MLLEGTVTNVTAFGAFVDVGVHQDGLVHVSQLADRFVKDPHEVVKAGDVVRSGWSRSTSARKRIALTMRSEPAGRGRCRGGSTDERRRRHSQHRQAGRAAAVTEGSRRPEPSAQHS